MDNYKGWLPKIKEWVEANKKNYMDDLMSIVRIKSVAEPGQGGYAMGEGCARVLDKAFELAESFGLETENDDYYCGSAIYRGASGDEVAIVGHLDVVPEGDGWDYEPYEPVLVETESGGEIVGRGACDNKGPSMAALYALRCLKELGVPLNHTVRMLWGCQEESGMTDMPHFLEKHEGRLPKLFLVCDCPFPIHYAEKGILTADLCISAAGGNIVDFHGGLVTNAVPDFAYIVLSGVGEAEASVALKGKPVEVSGESGNVRITAKGKAGHSAFPEMNTDNAINKLACAVADSGLLQGAAADAVRFVARATAGYYGENLGLTSEDEISGKTTCVGGFVRYEDNVVRQNINVRYAVTSDQDKLVAGLQAACAEAGVKVNNLDNNPPMYVPLDAMDGLPRKLMEISTELLDMGPLEPVVLAGGTHARKLPNAVGYGPGLGPKLEAGKKRIGQAHGVNESVDVETMLRAIMIYAATLIRIDDMI